MSCFKTPYHPHTVVNPETYTQRRTTKRMNDMVGAVAFDFVTPSRPHYTCSVCPLTVLMMHRKVRPFVFGTLHGSLMVPLSVALMFIHPRKSSSSSTWPICRARVMLLLTGSRERKKSMRKTWTSRIGCRMLVVALWTKLSRSAGRCSASRWFRIFSGASGRSLTYTSRSSLVIWYVIGRGACGRNFHRAKRIIPHLSLQEYAVCRLKQYRLAKKFYTEMMMGSGSGSDGSPKAPSVDPEK